MKKKTWITIAMWLVLLGIPYGVARHYGYIGSTFKITNPTNPLYNPDWFRFNDYGGRENKIEAFRKLFPVGTPKEFVDRVLVNAGGAKSLQIKEFPQVWNYSEPMKFGLPAGPMHQFIFNGNNEVENINFAVTQYLYPNRITFEELKHKKYPEEK